MPPPPPTSIATDRPSVITPGDRRYDDVRHTYGAAGAPAAVLTPAAPDDVPAAVRWAAEQPGPLAVRSGGHGPSTNDGGVVLDLGGLRGVSILDASRRLVRAEAGARWAEVADALDPHDLALSSGDYGDVGVGGLATGGGIGFFARRQGLTLDRIRAAEVVLADGTFVRADDREHADLLWAVRGAAGAVGVVTALELEAEPVGEVTAAELAYDGTDLPRLLMRWAALVEASPRALTSFLYVQGHPRASGLAVRATVVHAGDDAEAGRASVAPFAQLAPLLDQRVSRVRYRTLLSSTRSPHQAQAGGFTTRGGLVDHVTEDRAGDLADLLTSGTAFLLQVRAVGGAVNDLAPDATAYAHRSAGFSIVAVTMKQRRARLVAAWDAGIGRHVRGTYLNLESDRDEATLRRAFPAPTLARLHDVKRRYDPVGVFDHSLPLPSLDTSRGDDVEKRRPAPLIR